MTSGIQNLSYDIKNVTKDDREDVVQFLRNIFFKDEPLNAFLELVTDENPTCETLEEFTVRHIPDGVNLKAVQDNKMIALCLCVGVEKEHPDDPFDCGNEKYNKLVKLLDYAEKRCDPFTIYPNCTKGISVQVISVGESCRGRGVAATLLQHASDLAKQNGYEFMVIACTSLYSSKLAEKLKFKLEYSMKYSDYKENGETVFTPDLPHTHLRVYMKKL